jgi:hypothetical protein
MKSVVSVSLGRWMFDVLLLMKPMVSAVMALKIALSAARIER